jgi:hypothetical protein
MTENFIVQEYLEDNSICDSLIQYFQTGEQFAGEVYDGSNSTNKDFKDSTDCLLDARNPITAIYMMQLQKVVDKYIEKFPYSNYYQAWGVLEPPVIQHYAPGQGFKAWHSERNNANLPSCIRHLVYMTYLNDVTDQGGTEFFHQKLTVQPRKGLTVIWPADWTYTHRGIVSSTQEKYIITGWFSFYNTNK